MEIPESNINHSTFQKAFLCEQNHKSDLKYSHFDVGAHRHGDLDFAILQHLIPEIWPMLTRCLSSLSHKGPKGAELDVAML
jgi:hypothetical protein